MRRIAIFIAILLGIIVAGCPASDLHFVTTRNGLERHRIDGTIGTFDTDVSVSTNNPAMETCVAETGEMPGGEEIDLCADQVRSDKARAKRIQDWESSPYYGTYGSYAPSRMPGY